MTVLIRWNTEWSGARYVRLLDPARDGRGCARWRVSNRRDASSFEEADAVAFILEMSDITSAVLWVEPEWIQPASPVTVMVIEWRSRSTWVKQTPRYVRRLQPHQDGQDGWRVSNLRDATRFTAEDAAAFVLLHGEHAAGSMCVVSDPGPTAA